MPHAVPTKLFTHREFAFTLPGDIYLRYNSFANAEELKNEVLRLRPDRFEIGPVYSAKVSICLHTHEQLPCSFQILTRDFALHLQPRDKKTVRPTAFVPQRRELVFDIDMTDYDEIRTCCQDKGMCKRCWGFIAAATDVLDSALRGQHNHRPCPRQPLSSSFDQKLNLTPAIEPFLPAYTILPTCRPVWILSSSVGVLWSTRDPLLGVGHGRHRPHRRPTTGDRPLPRGRRRFKGHE